MSIYIGCNGVTRNAAHADCGFHRLRHVGGSFAGINGVVRKARNILDDINYINVKFTECLLGDGALNNMKSSSRSECEKYGSISISGNCARVYVSSSNRSIQIYSNMFVVFNDGHKVDLKDIIIRGLNLSCSISVSYYIAGNEGYFVTSVYDASLYNDKYYESISGSRSINTIPSTAWGSTIGAGKCSSYSMTCEQTYNSITIDGRSFSMRVENALP